MNNEKNKIAFIIAHKYIDGYPSYVLYYINNIIKFYPDALILIIDNKSDKIEKIKNNLPENKNLIWLLNDTECKYELGAYKVGYNYIINNNLLDKYDYIISTQENFILKNKFDFKVLNDKNILVCPINYWPLDGDYRHPIQDILKGGWLKEITDLVLSNLNMLDNYEKITFCWCNSFVISTKVLEKFLNYIQDIIITNTAESQAMERYLTRIFWELDQKNNYAIDGDVRSINYNVRTVTPFDSVNTHFLKITQNRQSV